MSLVAIAWWRGDWSSGASASSNYSGGGHLEETWDAHESIEKNHGRHGAKVDLPIAALLGDLEQRGLLDETLVVWGGEFGRKPFSEDKDAPGRNHNPYGFSLDHRPEAHLPLSQPLQHSPCSPPVTRCPSRCWRVSDALHIRSEPRDRSTPTNKKDRP